MSRDVWFVEFCDAVAEIFVSFVAILFVLSVGACWVLVP